jgi:hypothetical protein
LLIAIATLLKRKKEKGKSRDSKVKIEPGKRSRAAALFPSEFLLFTFYFLLFTFCNCYSMPTPKSGANDE